MNMNSSDHSALSGTKRRYKKPVIVSVGTIDALTTGSGGNLGDPPNDGSSYQHGAANRAPNAEVDLDGR